MLNDEELFDVDEIEDEDLNDDLGEDTDSEDDDLDESDESADDEEDQDSEEDESEEESEDESEPEEEEEQKPKQTPEQNAKNAERRRQQREALEARIREEVRQSSPEFKLAQRLAQQYGTTPEVMLERMEQAQLEKQAEVEGVSVEYLKRQQALERRVLESEFQTWNQRVTTEADGLKKEFPMLSDDDMETAKAYLLKTNNKDGSLESAVLALHGRKILTKQSELAKTEALAEVSGRKEGPLNPKGGKAVKTAILSAEEKAVAKAMGLSEADYIKWR